MRATAEGRFAEAPLQCDIVMKGGIASGVVYPGAVVALARRYRFKSIGGTSAGGIAAALVAAAEYSTDRAGFAEVAALPDELASEPHGRPFMLQLFQPEKANRALFGAIVGFLRFGPVRGTPALVRAFPRFPLVALALAVLSVVGIVTGVSGALLVAGLAIAMALLVAGIAFDAIRAVTSLGKTEFGLCRLGPSVGSDDEPALTAWLHGHIQRISGKAQPLTFADLWGVPEPEAEATDEDVAARTDELVRLSVTPRDRAIDLQMMTTDLTHGRPLRLPVPFQPHVKRLEEGGNLLFDPLELERFFPRDVIDHLERVAVPLSDETQAELAAVAPGRRLLRFPIGPDLPVVVATRMTLSFPVLISAVPLWELRYRAGDQPPKLRRVVFSDGGITSNFPVHFFDAPLPTRPTFALNLAGFEEGEAADPEDPCQAVEDPAAVNAPGFEPTAPVDSMLGFFIALKDAMQNWRDNAQARLPGFRERVVHIKLAAGEGGLNLTMPPDLIRNLSARGACAGDRLLERFSGPVDGAPTPTAHWNDSRFARYRVTMSVTERWLRNLRYGYEQPVDGVTTPYPTRIAAGLRPPYAFPSNATRAFAEDATADYVRLVGRWDASGQTLDGPGVPRPPATLRTVPPV